MRGRTSPAKLAFMVWLHNVEEGARTIRQTCRGEGWGGVNSTPEEDGLKMSARVILNVSRFPQKQVGDSSLASLFSLKIICF